MQLPVFMGLLDAGPSLPLSPASFHVVSCGFLYTGHHFRFHLHFHVFQWEFLYTGHHFRFHLHFQTCSLGLPRMPAITSSFHLHFHMFMGFLVYWPSLPLSPALPRVPVGSSIPAITSSFTCLIHVFLRSSIPAITSSFTCTFHVFLRFLYTGHHFLFHLHFHCSWGSSILAITGSAPVDFLE
ncbi:hypothetical protein GBF38_006505 [Nibea albiflora]|uniref:Uncharacterized protein n=1 Tax=Nibea albiflora TaxID=240163 RepID=A0ACB7EG06_NIBAL|nr:hypothetical protein GBF38_006505 [Nibea albiflora]